VRFDPEEVNRLVGEATSAGWAEGTRTWPATAETDAETIEVNGVTNRDKSEAGRRFVGRDPARSANSLSEEYLPSAPRHGRPAGSLVAA